MDLEDVELKVDVDFIIKSLLKENLLTIQDLNFLDLYIAGYSFREISNMTSVDKRVILTSINNSLSLIKGKCENV